MTILAPPDQTTLVDAPQPTTWTIVWRGLTCGEADIVGQHLSVLSLISGTDDFAALDIDPRGGHQRLMMMIATIVAVNEVGSLEDVTDDEAVAGVVATAIASVSAAPAEEILGSLRFG
jgi:hypothetical protein